MATAFLSGGTDWLIDSTSGRLNSLALVIGAGFPLLAFGIGTALGSRFGGHSWSHAIILADVAFGVVALGFTMLIAAFVFNLPQLLGPGSVSALTFPVIGLGAVVITSFVLDSKRPMDIE